MGRVVGSRGGSWFYLNLAPAVDKHLLPATGGRVSVSVGAPMLCLEVPGARSGVLRHTPLLYVRDGDDLVVIASAAGRPKHPAWFHNVLAAERFMVYAPGGRSGWYTGSVASGDRRERLWRKVSSLYPNFTVYAQRAAGREIPVVVLSRA